MNRIKKILKPLLRLTVLISVVLTAIVLCLYVILTPVFLLIAGTVWCVRYIFTGNADWLLPDNWFEDIGDNIIQQVNYLSDFVENW